MRECGEIVEGFVFSARVVVRECRVLVQELRWRVRCERAIRGEGVAGVVREQWLRELRVTGAGAGLGFSVRDFRVLFSV